MTTTPAITPFDFKTRNHSLDILRGVAILLVVGHHADDHLIPSFAGFEGAHWIWNFAFWRIKNLGWSGVDMFFVLSGFLIGGLLMNELDRFGKIRFGRFYLKRAFKILPSYVALVLGLSALGVVSLKAWQWPVFGLFLQNYLDPQTIGPTWSLAVEEHFYLLLPLLLMLLAVFAQRRGLPLTRGVPLLAGAVFAVCLGLRIARTFGPPLNDDFMMSHYRFDGLLLGVFCQYLWREHQARLGLMLKWRWVVLPLAAALIAPAMFASRNHDAMFAFGFCGLSIGYAILLLYTLQSGFGRLGDAFAGRGVAAVGRWSYNIYLWHFFIAALGVPGYWWIQKLLAETVAYPPFASLLQIAVLTAYSVAAGWLATVAVENPALLLRNRFLERLEKRRIGNAGAGMEVEPRDAVTGETASRPAPPPSADAAQETMSTIA